MRVALIQSAERLDRTALTVARTLRACGHEPTLVMPQREDRSSTPVFVSEWQAEGFAWIPVSSARLTPKQQNFPRDSSFIAARALADLTEGFDVAWFFQSHWAKPALRNRKFRDRLVPLVVLQETPEGEPIPSSLEETNRASSQQYARQWADAICNVQIDDVPESIRRIEALWEARTAAPARAMRPSKTSPAVTICIPYFEQPEFLPQTLQSLARQTSRDFTVVAVNDGSHSAGAIEVFNACAQQYANRGWKFLHQSNQFPGAARNRAAREASTEFLLFLDSDDIAMPAMVERFLRAALLTNDDCLVVPNYGFEDDPEGPCALLYDPPGDLIGSMGDDMQGGSCIFIRTESFWSVGGFKEVRGVGFEDYEFHVRCNLKGLRWDVLPEFLYRYRMPQPHNVSRRTSGYRNQRLVLGTYEERMPDSGLEQLPLAFASAYWRLEHATDNIERFQKVLTARSAKPKPPQLQLMLMTCYFPFGMISGWHWRVKEMIRYFGARYELTLVTQMTREQIAPASKEAFRYLKAVRGVEGTNRPAAGPERLPFRVRRHYTDNLQAALQALPTNEYHAVILDQIFMAEFRKDIDAPAILTEHNIESHLLRQASQLSWTDTLQDSYQNPAAEALLLEQYENRVLA